MNKRYTIQLNGDIYFEVDADSEEEALSTSGVIKGQLIEATEYVTPENAFNGRFYARVNAEPSIEEIEPIHP